MKRILFQVGTEFHYLVALSLIDKYYTSDEYEVNFIICSSSTRSRLNNILFDEKYIYHKIIYNHNEQRKFQDVLKLKHFIETNEFYHFVSFLYHDPLFVYFTYYFKSKNTTSFLAPDGTNAYVKFTSKNIKSRLVNTLNCYKFYKRHGIQFPKFWYTSWEYGRNGFYDYIYAYSKTLPYLPNKEIIEINYSLSQDKIESLKKTFKVDFSLYPQFSKVILIINQKNVVPKYESQLLTVISQCLHGYKIIVKKHPNQSNENLAFADDSIFVIDDVFPVELLMASIKDGIIISPYSASMLYHNPNCHYFWTYPIVEKLSEFSKPIERYNPKSFIKVVQDFSELKEHLINLNKV